MPFEKFGQLASLNFNDVVNLYIQRLISILYKSVTEHYLPVCILWL